MQARWLLGWDHRVMQKPWDEWTCALASCPSVRVVKVCRVARFVRAARVSLNDVWLVDRDSTFYWKDMSAFNGLWLNGCSLAVARRRSADANPLKSTSAFARHEAHQRVRKRGAIATGPCMFMTIQGNWYI